MWCGFWFLDGWLDVWLVGVERFVFVPCMCSVVFVIFIIDVVGVLVLFCVAFFSVMDGVSRGFALKKEIS